MDEKIIVEAVFSESTYVGEVHFPASVPEGLAGFFRIPDDLMSSERVMGLSARHIRFILGATRGKWALTVDLNLPDLAPKLGMTFAEIDGIVCDLIDKNYAQMRDRLILYRYWIVILHLRGIRFDVS